MALGPLLLFLNEKYMWQDTTLILTGIILNCAVCCALYRPLKPTKAQQDSFEQTLAQHMQSAEEDLCRPKPVEDDSARSRSSSITSDAMSDLFTLENSSVRSMKRDRFSRQRWFSERVDDDVSLDSMPPMLFRKCSLPPETIMNRMKNVKRITRHSITKINRPLNRKDIFLSMASISTLDKMTVPGKTTTEPAEVSTSVMEHVTVEPENLWETLKRTLADLLDTSLLLSPTYIAFVLQSGLVCFASMIPFIYLPPQAMSLGYAEKETTLLITYIGAVNIAGRVSCGYISDKPNIDPLSVQNVTVLLAGIATVLLPFAKLYWLLILYCAFFGLALASFYALRTIVCVNLLGIEKLTNAFGISLIFYGIAGLFGSPTAGK
ncbi:unnamed protein product [Soboliphyme baturini]|uniref:MFS domain-containing protein n=1 Tax=Soboliphyme baturini TaxID=241478 RepID=A0A183IHB9_9BILA|nr:unnamed protein product [Soboliphyme baturini]